MENPDIKQVFDEKGYVIVDSGLEESVLDGAIDDLTRFFGEDREVPLHVPHSDHGRIQDAWHISQNVLAIALSEKIHEALMYIYGKKAKPFQTLNFHKGTQQAIHSDSIHFNCEPFGAMCGVWTALEDIGEDQGPLIYYPGSHKLPEMNYDDFDLYPDYQSYPQYLSRLETLIEEHQFKPDYGVIKKGQSVIWAANVFHGGSFQNNKELTRHSQVTHFYMGNPKAWRPSESKEGRAYFEPETVKDMKGLPYSYPVQPVPVKPGNAILGFPMRVLRAIERRIIP